MSHFEARSAFIDPCSGPPLQSRRPMSHSDHHVCRCVLLFHHFLSHIPVDFLSTGHECERYGVLRREPGTQDCPANGALISWGPTPLVSISQTSRPLSPMSTYRSASAYAKPTIDESTFCRADVQLNAHATIAGERRARLFRTPLTHLRKVKCYRRPSMRRIGTTRLCCTSQAPMM